MSQLEPDAMVFPDPRWAGFRLIAVFVGLAISVGSWWVISNGKEGSTLETMELNVLSLKELYPQALSVAQDWQSDAFLSRASFAIQYSGSTSIPQASFHFWGPSPSINRGLIVFIRGIPPNEDIDTDEAEFPPERPIAEPIDPNDLPFDSMDALQIILDNGASEFLRLHPIQSWSPNLILERSGLFLSEGPLRWRAYFTGDDIHDTEYFKIDAYTGALIE